MSIKKVCDRCNKVKESNEAFDHIDYTVSDNREGEDSEYDLCPECAKLFSMFINGGTVEEDHYKDSKPCSVVIHKLADGHYGIENAPDDSEKNEPEKEKTSCTDDRPIMHCLSCKACDPCGGSNNDGYCSLNCNDVNISDVACEYYIII